MNMLSSTFLALMLFNVNQFFHNSNSPMILRSYYLGIQKRYNKVQVSDYQLDSGILNRLENAVGVML